MLAKVEEHLVEISHKLVKPQEIKSNKKLKQNDRVSDWMKRSKDNPKDNLLFKNSQDQLSAQELKDEPLANQANAPFILVGLDKGAEASGGKKPTFGVALTEAIVRPNAYNLVWHLDA